MRVAILALLVALTPSCATTNLAEWVNAVPSHVQQPVAHVQAPGGWQATAYQTQTNPSKALRMFGAFYAVLPCLAWDLVTLPVQVALGCKPYGD